MWEQVPSSWMLLIKLSSAILIFRKTKKRSYEFSDILVYRVISTDTPALSSRSSTSAAQTFLKQSILAQLCHLHRLVIIAMLTIVFIIQTRASVLSVTIFWSETRCVCIKLRTARRSCWRPGRLLLSLWVREGKRFASRPRALKGLRGCE